MISFSKQISGMPVASKEGEIGHVADLMLDAQQWRVLYLEVATGWLFGRHLVVPVQAIDRVEIPAGPVCTTLTRSDIESSPTLDGAEAFDEACEQRLMTHYGLPATARLSGRADPVSSSSSTATWLPPLRGRELHGYSLDAAGEIVGSVRDLLLDVTSWRVTSFLASLGGFLVPDMAEIGIGPVTGIDRERRIVHVATTKAAVDRASRLKDDELPYVLPELPPT